MGCDHPCENCHEHVLADSPRFVRGTPWWRHMSCGCVQAPCGHWFCYICEGRGRAEWHLTDPLDECGPAIANSVAWFFRLAAAPAPRPTDAIGEAWRMILDVAAVYRASAEMSTADGLRRMVARRRQEKAERIRARRAGP